MIAFDADQQGVAGRGGLYKLTLLAMQRVGDEQHARDAQLSYQSRHDCDRVRCTGQFLVCQHQNGVACKDAQHVDRLAIGQVAKTATQRLTVKDDRTQHFWDASRAEIADMTAKGDFAVVAAER
jgi:hypothetical protein